MADKFSALWISHSSISDFLTCPRSYYLKNVYKDPDTNKKIKIISPSLALGSVVHAVVESLSSVPVDERLQKPLLKMFDAEWENISGRKGGFTSDSQELEFKKRGEEMLRRVLAHPGPVGTLAVKINMDLPFYWLSESDEIILCGKIDWLEYIEDKEAVNIIDFKTGKRREESDSLQLPIYHLLVHNCQSRKVHSAYYWYLESEDKPTEVVLPDLESSENSVMKVAKKMKLARSLNSFECPNGEEGCYACRPFEKILKGEAEYVGKDNYGAAIYIVPGEEDEEDREGTLL